MGTNNSVSGDSAQNSHFNPSCIQFAADEKQQHVSLPSTSDEVLPFLVPPVFDLEIPASDVIPEMVYENDGSVDELLLAHTPVQNPPPVTPAPLETRIPIQSSYIAHARVGSLSQGAIRERRARNTLSARRSRARRADKISELQQENMKLMLRNEELVAENMRLQLVVQSLTFAATQTQADVKNEVNEPLYESF